MTAPATTLQQAQPTAKELPTTFNPKSIEEEIRRFWEDTHILAHVRSHLARRKPIGYVEGPPTLNGEPHVGHVRGRVMKDLWYRFQTMRGENVVFRGGWDTQGLPVELQAEAELGLKGSKAENLRVVGEERLVETCKELVTKYYQQWRQADKLLGLSLDDENAYWTYRNEYIEREWRYLETAWKGGLLGEGYRVVAYCPSCQTSLSNIEVGMEYHRVTDPSLYFKMRLRDEDAYLVLWTTMPFTVVTDELVGAKPDAEYVYARVGGETWVVAADRAAALMDELGVANHEVIKRVQGKALEGLRYDHPLKSQIAALGRLAENPRVHSIVAEDFVDISQGSGLVHLSPANGEEDFEVAQRRSVPLYNPIDDQVRFTEEAGPFAGLFVRDADVKVIQLLQEGGAVLKASEIEHDYPLCWRSNHKLVWLARREYFYWVDRLGDRAIKAAEKVEYFYAQPRNRFLEIVRERKPWNITRERVWGTPLPIWVCGKCGERTGAFSREQIVSQAVSLPDGPNFELHRPWIDRVVLRCPRCGADAHREPFVLDTWHNSGAAPFAGFSTPEYRRLVPVAFLTEGIDQTRGWAYTLLIENVLLSGKPQAPYKAFLFQGLVVDAHGNKMSKSLGNYVAGLDALEQNPVDVLRFYLVWKASPIDDLSFSQDEIRARAYQVLSTLYHLHVYFLQNSRYDGHHPETQTVEWASRGRLLRPSDLWILSRLQSLISGVTANLDRARYHEAARLLESFAIEALSQGYVPMTRAELWDDSPETQPRRLAVYAVLAHVLRTVDALFHPISPHLTEKLYQVAFPNPPPTILLTSWPSVDRRWVDPRLEYEFTWLGRLVSVANAARMRANVKRRWPLKEAIFYVARSEDAASLGKYRSLLQYLTNVKNAVVTARIEELPVKVSFAPNYSQLGPRLRNQVEQVGAALAKEEGFAIFRKFQTAGKVAVSVNGRSLTVSRAEVMISFAPEPGYAVAEREGIVVVVHTERDQRLLAEGLIRDLARRLQASRKERGYNPTDILEAAYIGGLDAEMTNIVQRHQAELRHLVRVRRVVVNPAKDERIRWSETELEGKSVEIAVQ